MQNQTKLSQFRFHVGILCVLLFPFLLGCPQNGKIPENKEVTQEVNVVNSGTGTPGNESVGAKVLDGGEVWFIHGFFEETKDKSEEIALLREIFPGADTYTVKRWDAPKSGSALGPNWSRTVSKTEEIALERFREIQKLPEETRKKLIVVGHSLGGRITVRMMARCAENGIQVRKFVLLGAAIDNDDPEIETALSASLETPCSVVNFQDFLLENYRVAQGAPALGTGYARIVEPTRLCEIASEQAMRHRSDMYLETYRDFVLNGEKIAKNTENIIVPQDYGNVEIGVTDAKVWWNNLLSCDDWQLQMNNVTGHCRILDPTGTRRAYGRREQMENAFTKVVHQLIGENLAEYRQENRPFPENVTVYVEVPQDQANANLNVNSDSSWWEDVESFEGWKIQRNTVTSHCRLLDPTSVRRAWGSQERMTNALLRVREEIEKGKSYKWD